jgi:uncharacterized membrane protein YjjP (DUF1212 family)
MTNDSVLLANIPRATAVAAAGSTLCNVGVHLAAQRLGTMMIGLTDTIVFSVIGAVAAAVVYALLGRFTQHAVRWFAVAATIAIGAYGVGPIAAAYTPYREGAPLFNMTTVMATEIMHIVSGTWILWALLRLARRSA